MNDKNLMRQYLLFLTPFYFTKRYAIDNNYFIIHKIDDCYGITTENKNCIIPYIISCNIITNDTIVDFSNEIRKYNTSIPLYFIIYNIINYKELRVVYRSKGLKKEKIIDLNNIDTKTFLIHNIFN